MLKPKPKLLTFWAFAYDDKYECLKVIKRKEDATSVRYMYKKSGVKCGPVTKIQLPAAGGSKK